MLPGINIEYTFELKNKEEGEFTDYNYRVELTLQDIIEFKFYQKYNKKFYPTNYYLEDGAKEFVKSIENDYMYNKIDTYDLLKSSEMYNFLKEKYEVEAHSTWLKSNPLCFSQM